MLRLVADENFDGRILRALQHQIPGLDVVRTQDTPLEGAADPDLLAWAAAEQRIVITHDLATLVGKAIERVVRGEVMPGVVAVKTGHSIGEAIADLELLILASRPEELDARIVFLPLR